MQKNSFYSTAFLYKDLYLSGDITGLSQSTNQETDTQDLR